MVDDYVESIPSLIWQWDNHANQNQKWELERLPSLVINKLETIHMNATQQDCFIVYNLDLTDFNSDSAFWVLTLIFIILF